MLFGILYKKKNCLCQLLNVLEVNDVTQHILYVIERLLSEPTEFLLKLWLLLKIWRSINEIPAKFAEAEGKELRSKIHELHNCVRNKE